MRAVCATGYAGPISLEIFNDQFRGGRTSVLAQDGYRSLVALMDEVRRAEPALDMDLPVIPAPARPKAVSFIEFATQGDEADALAALLSTLGFRQTATHVSKLVSLWQQGDIRIVLNSDTEGFANSCFALRGTTICDLGLTVENAAAAQARATALGAEAILQSTGPGELDIPAVKGLGGSILHFLDEATGLRQVWSQEFRASAQSDAPAGLRAVDHIAHTTSYDEMLSWSLFYTTLFEMEKTPILDVIDPDGVVRSQAVTTGDGGLRITLNGAETTRTFAGQFRADGLGASIQHVAFSTEDIFETARALSELGFEPLPIPGNYYDDLAARLDVSDDELSRLQAGNILLDADDAGRFYQLYSRPFANGMFFEIVCRTGDYSDFGAPNAPFRIAAQKRLGRVKGMPKA